MSVTNTSKQAENDPMSTLAELLIGGVSGAIERQEAAGQFELLTSTVLPTKGIEKLRETIEKNGGSVGDAVADDPMFTTVQLPAGWSKKAADHSMWSKLIDAKGRERAGIFYKAAFYDRSAHISLSGRFGIDSYGSEVDADGMLTASLKDACGEVTHTATGKVQKPENRGEVYEMREKLGAEVEAFLVERFPLWKDATQYWD